MESEAGRPQKKKNNLTSCNANSRRRPMKIDALMSVSQFICTDVTYTNVAEFVREVAN